MSRLRSVGARLSLALLVVVAGALGLVYLIVVPSLEQRLTDEKLAELERSAPGVLGQLPTAGVLQDLAENAAATTNSRVVFFSYLDRSTLLPQADSRGSRSSSDVADDPIARRAIGSDRLERGTVSRDGERFAEVAIALPEINAVLLLSASLADAEESARFVGRRLLLAGALALLVALLVGYGAAHVFARRIRRLQQAADRIAGGQFEEPVVDHGGDELGELAAAFESMRQRLANLDHARREFIANASHELRTPLFSLGGHLELLVDEELDEPTRREFLVTMREQVDRLTKLASELLDLSRLDAGRLRIERDPVDLGAIARLLGDEFRAVALRREHVLEIERSAEATALADEQRVVQIGRALVENAVLHSPPGTTIRVATAQENGTARLVVEDDGVGIPAEHVEHVFDRFYRIDGALASGSGLGLAIARELAEAMGGKIALDSQPGKTVFELSLPSAPQ